MRSMCWRFIVRLIKNLVNVFKIYRNIYVRDYKKFPYQKLTGRQTLMYRGKIICGVTDTPDEYDSKCDYYFGCDCDYPKWKNLQRVL